MIRRGSVLTSVTVALVGTLLGANGVGAAPASSAAIPVFDHIYLIVMENHDYGAIVGNAQAPYINGLIASGGLATQWYATTHPSQPNYLALFAGSTFGIVDDGVHHLQHTNLVDQLAAAHRTWRVYAQDYPGNCSPAASAAGPVDLAGLAGTYVRKHDPAMSFTDISGSATRCARISRLTGFDPAAADVELIVPNLSNDMHDGTIAQGDSFLRSFVPMITGSAAFANSLLVITWDEGSSNLGGGGHVATILVSGAVVAGTRSAVHHDHFSWLRTVEDAWGLPCMRSTCQAADLGEFFTH